MLQENWDQIQDPLTIRVDFSHTEQRIIFVSIKIEVKYFYTMYIYYICQQNLI